MADRKKTILFWSLLLIPSLLITGAAFNLIRHEQERINQAALSALQERLTTTGDTIQITIRDIQSELTESLMSIPEAQLNETLVRWSETNPLVRNGFVWDGRSEGKLIFPVDGPESTNEERRFIKRFDDFFTGRLPWYSNYHSSKNEQVATYKQNDTPKKTDNKFISKVDRFDNERLKLRELAKLNQNEASMSAPEKDVVVHMKKGWTPWFTGNRLCLLGWIQKSPDGPVYGVELELMAILSRLIPKLPELNTPETTYTLMDGNDAIFHQSGNLHITDTDKAAFNIPLSPSLPHWSLSLYKNSHGVSENKSYLYFACILLAFFMTAIVTGGILITKENRRNLQDAMEKTSFVSSVSHELKTPLTSIRMYAELLQTGRITQPEKVSRYLTVIVTESQRLTRLVNNILNFGRLEEGKKTYRLSDVNPTEVIDEILETHSIRIVNAGIKITVDLPGAEMTIRTDRDALEQVILNLIDNAIKYAASGASLTIRMDVDDPDFLQISIIDKGPGIPDNQREKIFDKFHRVDNSLTASQPGSGLGLSISRRILNDLGGDLFFRPNKPSGSCFTIKIRKNMP